MVDLLNPNRIYGQKDVVELAASITVRSLEEIKVRINQALQDKMPANIVLGQNIIATSGTIVRLPANTIVSINLNNFTCHVGFDVAGTLNISTGKLTGTLSQSGEGVCNAVSVEFSASPIVSTSIDGWRFVDADFVSTNFGVQPITNSYIDGKTADENTVLSTGAVTGTSITLAGGLAVASYTRSNINITGFFTPAVVVSGANVQSRNFNNFSAPSTSVIADGDYGDITVSGTGSVWTIDPLAVTTGKIADNAVSTIKIVDNAVTYAKIQDIPTDSLIGRDAAGTGVSTSISLNGTLSMTGANVLQRAALAGDVTAPAGSNTTTIANNAVTNAKLRDSSSWSVIGNPNSTSGDPQDIFASALGHVLRRSAVTNTLGFGFLDDSNIAAGGLGTVSLADNSVTDVKLRDSAGSSVIGRASPTSGDPADIISVGVGNVLRDTGIGLAWGLVDTVNLANLSVITAKVADNAITGAKLRDSTGLSVIGNPGISSADPVDIAASGSGDVLRVGGTSIGWGTIPQTSVDNLVADLAARVVGPTPATSTDNAIVRWDGTTGRLIQNSSTRLEDNGQIIGFSNNSLPLYSFSADQTDGFGRDSLGDLYVANNGIRSLVVGQDNLVFQSTDTNGGFVLIKNTAKQNGFGWENWPDTYLTHSNSSDTVAMRVNGAMVAQFDGSEGQITTNSTDWDPTVPRLTSTLDTTSGIGFSAFGQVDLVVNNFVAWGAQTNLFLPGNSTAGSPVLRNTGVGSAATPNYTFFGRFNTGIYSPAANTIGLGVNSTQIATVGTTGLRTIDGTSTAPVYSFTSDTSIGMFRPTTNTLGFTAGTTGQYWTRTGTVNTTSTTPVTIITFATTTGASYGIQYTSACRQAGSVNNGSYVWNVRVINNAGTVTAVGMPVNENPPVGTIQGPSILVSGTNVLFRVAGTAGITHNWAAKLEILPIGV